MQALIAGGAPQAVVEKVRADMRALHADDDYEVWPENWETLMLFLDLSTCWTWVTPGMGTPMRVGIPASEIESTMRLRSVPRRDRLAALQDLRQMEAAAIHAFREAQR